MEVKSVTIPEDYQTGLACLSNYEIRALKVIRQTISDTGDISLKFHFDLLRSKCFFEKIFGSAWKCKIIPL